MLKKLHRGYDHYSRVWVCVWVCTCVHAWESMWALCCYHQKPFGYHWSPHVSI